MLRDIGSTDNICDSISVLRNIIIGGKDYEILFKVTVQNKKTV